MAAASMTVKLFSLMCSIERLWGWSGHTHTHTHRIDRVDSCSFHIDTESWCQGRTFGPLTSEPTPPSLILIRSRPCDVNEAGAVLVKAPGHCGSLGFFGVLQLVLNLSLCSLEVHRLQRLKIALRKQHLSVVWTLSCRFTRGWYFPTWFYRAVK